jgi:aerobic carbon-monoxide dehydrogenase medium subunit
VYSAEFDYYRAGSVAEASDLLKKYPGAKLLAGGHSLIPLLKLRLASPTALIDIGRIAELKGITVSDGTIRIGPLTTHAELAASPELREHCPALAEAAARVGDPAVRNRGTIGGNVAHADPASDLPTVLAAVGARMSTAGPGGRRTVDARDFCTGMMTTTLGDQDVLTGIDVPARKKSQGQAYAKFEHPASRYAVIGVAAVITVSGGKCTGADIAVGGCVPRPVRATSVEKALTGQVLSPEAIAQASRQVAQDLGDDILGDLYASADYRKNVASVWVKRAITAAVERTN